MPHYEDLYFKSHDGLTLYSRDYSGTESAATVICLPGLTRNSADFEELCESLAGEHRILAVDLRGRGRSDSDPNPLNYHPATYAQDIGMLLKETDLSSAVFVGTSLGGLVSMTLAATMPEAVQGIVLNDIGPEVNPAGLVRIQSYLANSTIVTNWKEAINHTRAIHEQALKGLSDEEWATFTRRLYHERKDGVPELYYDPDISVPFNAQGRDEPQADLWPLFTLLTNIPFLVFRGGHSDILTAETLARMAATHPRLTPCEVKGRGHAPLLNETGVVSAIRKFIVELTG